MQSSEEGTEQERRITAQFIANYWTADSGIAHVLLLHDPSNAPFLDVEVIDEASKNKLQDVRVEGIAFIPVTVKANSIRLNKLLVAHARVLLAFGPHSPQAVKFHQEHSKFPEFTALATLGRTLMLATNLPTPTPP